MPDSNQPSRPNPVGSINVLWALALSLITYAFGLSVRLLEAPLWLDGDTYRIADAFLLATADAYYWLAGAEGLISTARSGRTAIPEIVDFLSRTTNVPHALIAFWLPVILAPLTAIPVCVLAVRWRLPEAGLVAGLLAVAAPGYLYRTRLGFLDDDMLLVLFPIMLVAGLIVWLGPLCRETWLGGQAGQAGDGPDVASAHWFFWGALLLGGWVRMAFWYYPKATVLILSICLFAVIMAALLAKSGHRIGLFLGFMLILALALADTMIIGAVVALIAWAFFFRTEKNFSIAFLFWASLPASLLAGLLYVHVSATWESSFTWLTKSLERRPGFSGFDPVAVIQGVLGRLDNTDSSLTIQQKLLGNVSELQILTPWETMHLLTAHPVIFFLGLAGFMVLIWKRPLALLLLPLFGVGVLAFQLGARYTVFSGVVWGLGTACGFALVLRAWSHKSWVHWLTGMVLCLVIVWIVWPTQEQIKPTPAMHRQTALALRELDTIAAPDATIWIHWDLAYAGQYYARRKAFAAIGSATQLLRIAPPLAADNPATARKLIRQRVKNGEVYLVVDFFTLGKAESVLRAGTWNAKKQESAREGMSRMMDGAFPINMFMGIVADTELKTIELKSLDILTTDNRSRFEWLRPDGLHLILNQEAHRAFIMDKAVYDSLATQLLIQEPKVFRTDMQVVMDYLPWVRIFQVE